MIIISCAFSAYAQKSVFDLRVYESDISKEDGKVTVTFRAEVGKESVKKNYSKIYAPLLTDDNYSWSLPPVVVQGKKAKINYERQMLASGNETMLEDALFAVNGGFIEYSATIPYQQWMENARLEMEGLQVGCCSVSPLAMETMIEEIVLQPEKTEEPVIFEIAQEIEPVEEMPKTTIQKLAEEYAFIEPVESVEKVDTETFYDDDREKALAIHCRQGYSNIDPNYMDNAHNLEMLLTSIRQIEKSKDSRMKLIMVAGFASPEGAYAVNDRLAWNRAVAMKEYIVKNSSLDPSMIVVHNGAEDWRGLRLLVEQSDMAEKQQILNIIDNVPIWDSQKQVGRMGEIMRLDGGIPYKYMLENLFPQLRAAAYVKIFF